MTNKELLELAAKAAGIEIVGLVDKMIIQPDHRTSGFIIRNDRGGDSCWNPLTDDGDALRLAGRLNMSVSIHNNHCMACAQMGTMQTVKDLPTEEATRRAIVRAAAEIGKTK